MTTTAEQAAGAALNGAGQAPAADEEDATAVTTIGERLMGVIGIAFAAGLLLIGLDLMTGGAVGRAFTRLGATGDDGNNGG